MTAFSPNRGCKVEGFFNTTGRIAWNRDRHLGKKTRRSTSELLGEGHAPTPLLLLSCKGTEPEPIDDR